MKKLIFLLAVLVISFGCQSEDNNDLGTKDNISISDEWMRPGAMHRNSAAFMTIMNNSNSDDTLFSVNSGLAQVVELHETFSKDNDIKGMRHVDEIVIPAHSKLELKPGGYHIMLIGLISDLNLSDTGIVVLNFKQNGGISTELIAK